MTYVNTEEMRRAAATADSAADSMRRSANTVDEAVRTMSQMFEQGYGGPGLRLIELLEGFQIPEQVIAASPQVTDEQINNAAQIIAASFDYPWKEMPEEGKNNMRDIARRALLAPPAAERIVLRNDGSQPEDMYCMACDGHGSSADGSRDCVRCGGTGEKQPAPSREVKPREEFLKLAESAGGKITGKPDGSEPIEVVFTIQAWWKFDAAAAADLNFWKARALEAENTVLKWEARATALDHLNVDAILSALEDPEHQAEEEAEKTFYRNEGLEQAAKAAEGIDVAIHKFGGQVYDDGGQTRSDIVAAIRALKTQLPQGVQA